MRGIEKIKQTFENLNKSVIRFPITMTCSVIMTIYLILEIKNGWFLSYNPMIETLLTGILLSINLHLFEERWLCDMQDRNRKRIFRAILWIAGGAFICCVHFILLNPVEGDTLGIHEKDRIYFGLNLFLMISFMYISKIKRNEGYVVYIFEIIGSFAKALVYSIVMYLGVAAIIFTLVHLLELPLYSEIYGYMASAVFNLFLLAVFLSDFPDSKDEFQGYEMVRAWRVLLLSIVVPLLSIYTVILYIYFAKIIVLSRWPNGLVAHLVLWYGMFSVAIVFFLSALQENKPFLKKFSIFYSVAMLPLLCMMFISVWIRVKEYGITENRYYVIMAGVWVCSSVLYYIRHYVKKQDSSLIFIPIILSVAVLISSIGPMSAYRVEKRSQVHELVKVLQRNDMIQDGKIVPKYDLREDEQERISELVSYIMANHKFEDIPNMPCSEKDYSFEKVFGFAEKWTDYWEDPQSSFVERVNIGFYGNEHNKVEDISEFDRKYNVSFYSPGPEDNDMQDQKPFIVRKEDGLVLYFYDLGDKVYTEKIPFDKLYEQVSDLEKRQEKGEEVERYLEYEGEDIKYRLVIEGIMLERIKEEGKDSKVYKECNIQGDIYYRLKK